MIVNRTFEVRMRAPRDPGVLFDSVCRAHEGEPLRWFISEAGPGHVRVEATECLPAQSRDDHLPAAWLPTHRLGEERVPSGLAVAISLVPTGIGCAIGGYAGDASPASALLGSAVDLLVTNPNAVNASSFIGTHPHIVYTEGYTLDLFSRGETALRLPRANRIGVIIEQAPDAALTEVFNIVNAVRAVHGIEVVGQVVTDEPVGTRCSRHDSGAYVGTIDRPDMLIAAGQKLLDTGATALAVTTNVRDLPTGDYAAHFAGSHPNPVGGAEAIVSHLLTRVLGIPAAHAPMLNFARVHYQGRVVDPRSAGEYVSASGLPCVLMGLHKAPQIAADSICPAVARISMDDVIAVVAPATALGAVPVLAAAARGIPVIAVRDNTTILDVTADKLGLTGVVEVADYFGAAGALLALRAGISLGSLRRPLAGVGPTAMSMALTAAQPS